MVKKLKQLFCKHSYKILSTYSKQRTGGDGIMYSETTHISICCRKCDHKVSTTND